jgi:lysozyme
MNYKKHHHHRDYEAHLIRKKKRARKRLLRKIGNIALGVFLGVSLLMIVTTLIAPDWLLGHFSHEKDLGSGVTTARTDNRHLKRDYDGIDVSHHQGIIDWQCVAKDTCVKFVYIKATEGSTMGDSNYLQNVRGAKRAGIPLGSYHYLTSQSSITAQFRNYYGVVNRKLQDIIPMIDIEEEGVRGWSKQEIQDSLARMIRLIEQHYYHSPIIYAYAKFYNENLAPRFNSYHLFLARYNENEPVVSGAGQHNIWQHSDQGVVDGIETLVDLNVFADDTSLKDIKMKQTESQK